MNPTHLLLNCRRWYGKKTVEKIVSWLNENNVNSKNSDDFDLIIECDTVGNETNFLLFKDSKLISELKIEK